jgi:hypothetical protein
VFDTGGALAKTYNAATFVGSGSTLSAIQAAINQASIDGVSRVYLPASMYPYSASSISFINTVRMVREGGDWSKFDAFAYGASGNSSADDHAALQALATATGYAGGIAFIPAGTYLTSDWVLWPDQTQVVGDGRDVTIIKRKASSVTDGTTPLHGAVFSTGPSTTTTYIAASRGTFLVFRDFTIDGNAAGNPGVSSNNPHADGIALYHVGNVRVDNVTVRNCLNSGVYAFGTRRLVYTGVETSRCGQLGGAGSRNGFSITGFNNIQEGVQDEHLLLACSAISNVDEGFMYGDNGLISFIGCISRDNGDMGIEGDSGSASTLTVNNPRGIVIQGCHIYNNAKTGIGLSSSNVARYIITGNSIESHGESAIALNNNSNSKAVITGNSIHTWGFLNTATHGIQVGGGFDEIVIRDNVLAWGGTGGIVLLAGGAGSALTMRRIVTGGNIIREAGTNGISIAGPATGVIGDDLIDRTGNIGIQIQAGGSGQTIQNLRLLGTVVKNSGWSIGGPGIRIRTTASGSTVSGIQLLGVISTDDQAAKTQTFGLTLAESGCSVQNIRLVGCDFQGNASGTVSGEQSWMWEIGMLESLSSQSVQGTLDFTRATLSLGTAVMKTGTALNPSMAFSSESSLGWYRSGNSTMCLSYGTIAASNYSSTSPFTGDFELSLKSGNVMGPRTGAAGTTYTIALGTISFVDGNGGTGGGRGRWTKATALNPSWAINSEISLGLYQSAVSAIGLSYGAFQLPNGSNTTPSLAYSSTSSLGFYSSGAQTIAQSLGTFNLATNAVRLSMRTLAASAVTASAAKTNVAVDEVVFTIGGASGASLIIYSGGTAYGFNSAFSAAAS